MSREPKDGVAAHQQDANTIYDRNAATPLPPPAKGEFYSHNMAAAQVEQRATELYAEAGMSAAESSALANTFREIQKATGLPDVLLAQIADGRIDTLLAASRISADPDAEALERDRQIVANNAELRETFVRNYGAKDGEQLLARTQKFIRAHPKLAAMLREGGLGSRLDIVEGVASHVFSSGYR